MDIYTALKRLDIITLKSFIANQHTESSLEKLFCYADEKHNNLLHLLAFLNDDLLIWQFLNLFTREHYTTLTNLLVAINQEHLSPLKIAIKQNNSTLAHALLTKAASMGKTILESILLDTDCPKCKQTNLSEKMPQKTGEVLTVATEVMLEKKANIDNNDNTLCLPPLYYAVEVNNPNMVEIICEYAARLEDNIRSSVKKNTRFVAENKFKNIIEQEIVRADKTKAYLSPLEYAQKHSKDKRITDLLSKELLFWKQDINQVLQANINQLYLFPYKTDLNALHMFFTQVQQQFGNKKVIQLLLSNCTTTTAYTIDDGISLFNLLFKLGSFHTCEMLFNLALNIDKQVAMLMLSQTDSKDHNLMHVIYSTFNNQKRTEALAVLDALVEKLQDEQFITKLNNAKNITKKTPKELGKEIFIEQELLQVSTSSNSSDEQHMENNQNDTNQA